MIYSNLVITGSLAKDTIFLYDGLFGDSLLPEHLNHLSVSFQSQEIVKSLGGPLLNIAYSAQFFCKDNVKLLGYVGKDGQDILDFIKALNLDITGIKVNQQLYTATGSCITDKQNNQIWGFCDGAGQCIKDIDISKYCKFDSLFLIAPTNKLSVVAMVNQAIDLRIDYIYDVGMHIPVLEPRDLQIGIDSCKYLIVNEYEIEQIKSKIDFDEKAFVMSGRILIITLGSKGVRYLAQSQDIFVPAYTTNCIDPVGAGDAWRGAFFGELISGKELIDCLIMGNVIASMAVESSGGVNYSIDITKVQNRFDSLRKKV